MLTFLPSAAAALARVVKVRLGSASSSKRLSAARLAAKRLMGLGARDIQVANPYIVSGEDHRFLAAEQLRETRIELGAALLEPIGRNTAPALTLAALAAKHNGTDPILGITPDRPETGYGYIKTTLPSPPSGGGAGGEGERRLASADFYSRPFRRKTQRRSRPNARKYWSVLKTRLKKEGSQLATNCSQLKMLSADGKNYLTDVADTEQLLRLIQSIKPSSSDSLPTCEPSLERKVDSLAETSGICEFFYREYKSLPNLQPLAAEIAWTKNTLILDRCADPLQREFYLRATARFGWTRRVLEHQIDNQTYEKYLLNQTSFDNALPQALAAQAKLAVKDHYTFAFLELADAHEERELEAALLASIQRFLAEMGPHFTFVGSQYRLVVEGNDYSIDLLLYHRTLKSLIAVELKIGEFQPEHKGKMEFYLVALNEQVKLPDENDAIGIIICKSTKKTVVEYALKTATQPTGVATYSLTSHLPAAYQHLLPNEEEIRDRLQGWSEHGIH